MRRLCIVTMAMIIAVACMPVWAAEFKPYPGAKLDAKATKDAQAISAKAKSKVRIYTTNDTFEKVYDFYKGVAKEFAMPPFSPKGKKSAITGQIVKSAIFICDDAKDLMNSKLWIKVQRPAIGLYMEDLEKSQDVTAIIVSEKK